MGSTVRAELDDLRYTGLHRSLVSVDHPSGPYAMVDGKRCLVLCSNNYLGLADHPRLRAAAEEAARHFGCGCGASRLVSGNSHFYDRLEETVAEFEGKEAALVFSSGYMANIGLISTIAREGDTIFSDQFNHASIVDGCRLSRARTVIFNHNDTGDLADKLRSGADDGGRKIIVVESVYSVEGDMAPLREIRELATEHGCTLVVDEAHATGIHGHSGRGGSEQCGVEPDIVVGTFGKALGTFGAFVSCSIELREYLINRARSIIFTTALPPPVLSASIEAFSVVREEPWRRTALIENAEYLRDALTNMGLQVRRGSTQIIPVIVDDAALALEASRLLRNRGVFVRAIRPPSVPPGTSRLRVTPMATHSRGDLDAAVRAFADVGKELRLI